MLVIEFEDWNDSFIDYFETLFVFTRHQQSGNNWVHTGLFKCLKKKSKLFQKLIRYEIYKSIVLKCLCLKVSPSMPRCLVYLTNQYLCIYEDEFGVKILRNDFILKSCIVLKKLKMLQKLVLY